jgi:hypothetical protein
VEEEWIHSKKRNVSSLVNIPEVVKEKNMKATMDKRRYCNEYGAAPSMLAGPGDRRTAGPYAL